jgi:hypothetical protein
MPCPGSGAASSILRLTHNQVMAGPPDVTPAVDHHVRLATTPSIGIAGQNWAEIAAGVSADRSGYLSTVMHWALASSQHSLDVLIIEHGSRRAIAFSDGRRAGNCGGAPQGAYLSSLPGCRA